MNAFRRIALLAAVMLPASGTAFGAPRVRDVWHAHVADGQRYGSEHTVVARLPDGNYRITRESRVLLDVLGLNKEEVIERGEYVVTPDYRPVSIAGEGKRGSGTTRFAARRRGEALEVTATVAGVDRARTFEKAVAMLPGPCLDDWLADRPTDFMAGEVVILDDESCELKTAKVEAGQHARTRVGVADRHGDRRGRAADRPGCRRPAPRVLGRGRDGGDASMFGRAGARPHLPQARRPRPADVPHRQGDRHARPAGVVDRRAAMEGHRLRPVPPGGRSPARRRAVAGGRTIPRRGADRASTADREPGAPADHGSRVRRRPGRVALHQAARPEDRRRCPRGDEGEDRLAGSRQGALPTGSRRTSRPL